MSKKFSQRWITAGIIITTTILVALFLYAVYRIYTTTLTETKQIHKQQQLEMAKAAVIGIGTYLERLENEMYLFDKNAMTDPLFENENSLSIQSRILQNSDNIISSIFISSKDGRIKTHHGQQLPNWINRQFLSTLPISFKAGSFKAFYTMVQPNTAGKPESGFTFCIFLPVFHPSKKKQEENLLLSYVINFNTLVDKFIAPLNLSQSDFAWIIDGHGRLIFHPRHDDMLLRNINKTEEDCRDCHKTFNMQKEMLNSEASYGEYKIGDEETKIMAYMPLVMENEKWVLVISTFLPMVTASLRENFTLFFILGFIILAIILVYGIAFYRVNAGRIRAEDEQVRIQQTQQLKDQLNQSSKLASIGELVDTAAHEINTPVGIIAAQADALSLQNRELLSDSEELMIIKNQVKRISNYTRSLLSYSKRVPYSPKPVDVNLIIEECLYLLNHRFKSAHIKIEKKMKQIPQISADPLQLEQVIINILNNAVDAISKKGTIFIETEALTGDQLLSHEEETSGIKITFRDNGPGIESAHLDKIFNPFFSTKNAREGTGLGLYICQAILNRHRGKIEVNSIFGQGASFMIYLPLSLKTGDGE